MIVLVGENFQQPRLAGRWDDRWNARLALKIGAFNVGKSREMLDDLGFRWDMSANLCPPMKWSWNLAEKVSTELKMIPRSVFILAGARVARSFGAKADWCSVQGNLVVIPHPSPRCAIWEDPKLLERARAIASELRADLGLGKASDRPVGPTVL